MQFLQGILTGAPLWVWPLLALLIWFGIRSSRTRSTPMALIYALPFLGVMTVRTLFSLPEQPVAWTAFGVGYGLAVVAGYAAQKRWVLEKNAGRVTLKGEWLTFTVLMIVFWANFVSGAMQAVSPETYASSGFIAGFALLIGAASGSFLGRSARVIRM